VLYEVCSLFHHNPYSNLFVSYLRITLLGLTGLTGEDNELSLVSLQALNVKFKRLVGLVATTEIDSNTDGKGFLATDTSFL
jgi:hypothetical protein